MLEAEEMLGEWIYVRAAWWPGTTALLLCGMLVDVGLSLCEAGKAPNWVRGRNEDDGVRTCVQTAR